MKYYEVKNDYSISEKMKLKNEILYDVHFSEEEVDKISNLAVNYFIQNRFMQYSDIITEPIFLISDSVKLVFSLYDKEIKYKSIQVFAEEIEDNTNYLYHWPYIKFIKCLSKNTNIYPNGVIKKLVLDKELIKNKHIFYIKDILQVKLVVSQVVVESFLRRGLYGVVFEEIEIE